MWGSHWGGCRYGVWCGVCLSGWVWCVVGVRRCAKGWGRPHRAVVPRRVFAAVLCCAPLRVLAVHPGVCAVACPPPPPAHVLVGACACVAACLGLSAWNVGRVDGVPAPRAPGSPGSGGRAGGRRAADPSSSSIQQRPRKGVALLHSIPSDHTGPRSLATRRRRRTHNHPSRHHPVTCPRPAGQSQPFFIGAESVGAPLPATSH